MEEYIETFLYILLTIVFIIVGSLNKKKRKAKQNSPSSVLEEQPAVAKTETKNIFDYFEEQLNTSFETEVVDNQTTPAYIEEPDVEKLDPPEMEEDVEKQILIDKNEMKESIKSEHSNYFDLRKAVIYSEILNRKSY
jgi:hypothetical protein